MYRVILADPPWKYGQRRYQDGGRKGLAADHKYPVMSTKDICELPVSNLADGDCALFIWSTDAHLQDCMKVISAWGFEYRTIAFVWVKRYPSGKPRVMVAPWTLKSTEICLLGVKGSPKRVSKNVRALIEAEVLQDSQKPAEVRERIENMFGDVRMIELFARERRGLWDVFGNQVKGSIRLPTKRAEDGACPYCKDTGLIFNGWMRGTDCTCNSPRR